MKPRMAGGLMRLLIPDTADSKKWTTIINPVEMEKHLMEHCQEHFKQAHGSPYTVPPLSTLLNYDSLTPFGKQISQGTANLQDIEISHHAKLLL